MIALLSRYNNTKCLFQNKCVKYHNIHVYTCGKLLCITRGTQVLNFAILTKIEKYIYIVYVYVNG